MEETINKLSNVEIDILEVNDKLSNILSFLLNSNEEKNNIATETIENEMRGNVPFSYILEDDKNIKDRSSSNLGKKGNINTQKTNLDEIVSHIYKIMIDLHKCVDSIYEYETPFHLIKKDLESRFNEVFYQRQNLKYDEIRRFKAKLIDDIRNSNSNDLLNNN